MNKLEAAKLLTIASGFDRFVRADEVTSTAWAMALVAIDYHMAEKAVVAHYSGDNAHKQLMPADIIKTVQHETRMTRSQIEADVRAAKSYGLIDKEWPPSGLLPDDVRQQLRERRDLALREALDAGDITALEFSAMERDIAAHVNRA